MDGLENQLRPFRVTRELADVRRELKRLRLASEQTNAELRREIGALDARVTRLEHAATTTPTPETLPLTHTLPLPELLSRSFTRYPRFSTQ